MTAIDEIKSRLDIVDIVSETVKLRHSGKNYTGFCPFIPIPRPLLLLFSRIPKPGDVLGNAMRAETSSVL